MPPTPFFFLPSFYKCCDIRTVPLCFLTDFIVPLGIFFLLQLVLKIDYLHHVVTVYISICGRCTQNQYIVGFNGMSGIGKTNVTSWKVLVSYHRMMNKFSAEEWTKHQNCTATLELCTTYLLVSCGLDGPHNSMRWTAACACVHL